MLELVRIRAKKIHDFEVKQDLFWSSSSINFMKSKGYVVVGWSVRAGALDIVVGGELLPPSPPSLPTHISAPSPH